MLFNSYVFIFAFLPLTCAGFYVLTRASLRRTAMTCLALCSLFYYGWWAPEYLILLLGSLTANFAFGRYLGRAHARRRRHAMLAVGVAANLALLGYYKYAGFFVGVVNAVSGAEWTIDQIILPLGISFYTFQQVAYLVDAYRGQTREYDFIDYTLFVTFFPQLIAGPIVHHGEMMPQFASRRAGEMRVQDVSAGLTMFTLGLFKKVMVADVMATYASPIFGAAALGRDPTLAEAWIGALAYTMQLYFDFSGYSDMAIGLARMFGVRLPANFNSPYKSLNIVDFWRRWHMTLSRFLRDYLYIPLGGSRRGPVRRYANLFVTMLLGGMWHGAGWTFIFWGGLHGAYLMVNHAWWRIRGEPGRRGGRATLIGRAAAWSLTFLAVVVGWVFFRAPTFDAAWRMLGSMFLLNGFDLGSSVSRLGAATWLAVLMPIVVFAPNTQQIMRSVKPVLDATRRQLAEQTLAPLRRLRWTPGFRWALLIAAMLVLAILNLARPTEFIYFQF